MRRNKRGRIYETGYLGWHRAGTLNLNIRYAHLSMVLVAQAAIHQLRQRLGAPFVQWDATHLARNLFGIEQNGCAKNEMRPVSPPKCYSS